MKMKIEKRSIDYIPLAERHGKVWHLWPIWFSGDAHLATLAVGVIGIGLGGNLLWTAIAVIAGCALGTFFMSFHSTQGPQLGLAQLIQSRPQFGYMGALLVWVVALVAYIGYNAFNEVLVAQSIRQLTGASREIDPPVIIVFAVLAAAIAAVGYDWIHKTQRWLAYLMLAVLGVFTVAAAFTLHLPARHWRVADFDTIPFLVQFFAAAAYQLSWSIYVSDYSRYLPREVSVRESFWWTYVGAFIGGVWMMLLGTLAAALFPAADVAGAVQMAADTVLPGLGAPLLVAGLLGLVTITSLNFYGASLALLSIADSIKPSPSTVTKRLVSLAVAVIVCIGLALVASKDFVHSFDDLLAVLLYLLTPWTAINLIDFYVVRRGHYSIREIFNPNGLYGRWNWRGLVSYGVGFVAMIPFVSSGLYKGPVAIQLGGADVSMLVGLPVSALLYWYLCRNLDLAAEQAAIAAADAGLDQGATAG
jgi:NCS1 family nucleobase:cation symporter-1